MLSLSIANIITICYYDRGDVMKDFFDYDDDDISMHFSCDIKPHPEDFKMHTHEKYELYYFASGKGIYRIEGNAYPLESGDILIMRSAESHYIDINPNYPYTRMSINFDDSILSSVDKYNVLLSPFNLRDAGKLNRYRETDFINPSYRIFINNIITYTENKRLQTITNLIPLLNEIYIAFQNKNNEENNNSVSYNIIRYINNNLTQNITLDTICKDFFISKPQLCRIFKAATGSTVWDYITVKRLVFARRLIASGIPPTKVFSECGFNDYSVFYRAYHKKYGISPNQKIM